MYQRILVPFDDSPTSNAGLGEAIKLAKLTGASIRLVYVLDTLPLAIHAAALTGDILGIMAEAGSAALLEGKRRVTANGVPVETFLSDTYGQRVCEVVAEQVEGWNADLIVIGTHGRRGVRRLRPRQRCRADRSLGAGPGAPGSDDAARARGQRRSRHCRARAGRERCDRLIARWATRTTSSIRVRPTPARASARRAHGSVLRRLGPGVDRDPTRIPAAHCSQKSLLKVARLCCHAVSAPHWSCCARRQLSASAVGHTPIGSTTGLPAFADGLRSLAP